MPIFIDINSAKTYNRNIPRIARVVAAGYPSHITRRGNYRQKIFADGTDQKKYLSEDDGLHNFTKYKKEWLHYQIEYKNLKM